MDILSPKTNNKFQPIQDNFIICSVIIEMTDNYQIINLYIKLFLMSLHATCLKNLQTSVRLLTLM